ncbi:MAG: hypothetical protein E7238_00135 [Sarcina sp.]|nr:hypothetical protein [Sarcina sp.]
MEKKLLEVVTADQVLTWIVIAFLVGYFIYKEWPEFKRRVSGGAVAAEKEAAEDKSVCDRLSSIESDIRQIKEKLDRDYNRINDMERWRGSVQRMVADSLEEREILMQAMLGVLGGLQEIGANGPTKKAEEQIRNYLNRKAHAPDD